MFVRFAVTRLAHTGKVMCMAAHSARMYPLVRGVRGVYTCRHDTPGGRFNLLICFKWRELYHPFLWCPVQPRAATRVCVVAVGGVASARVRFQRQWRVRRAGRPIVARAVMIPWRTICTKPRTRARRTRAGLVAPYVRGRGVSSSNRVTGCVRGGVGSCL